MMGFNFLDFVCLLQIREKVQKEVIMPKPSSPPPPRYWIDQAENLPHALRRQALGLGEGDALVG